eukprot:jgi/Mesvir1/467/Mv11342-RA.1
MASACYSAIALRYANTDGGFIQNAAKAPLSASRNRPQKQCGRPVQLVRCSGAAETNHQTEEQAQCPKPAASSRRAALALTAAWVCLPPLRALAEAAEDATASGNNNYTDMVALRGKDYGKTQMAFADFIQTPSGLQYKDMREGQGEAAKEGDLVVIDWDGYTLGYYGRPFEARNKVKGGAFTGEDKDFLRFRLGGNDIIPAFNEVLKGMKPGGIRRLIVTPDLGYPGDSFDKGVGPVPSTFSGKRALDFVLKNQGMIDKTLLFDVELMKIVK